MRPQSAGLPPVPPRAPARAKRPLRRSRRGLGALALVLGSAAGLAPIRTARAADDEGVPPSVETLKARWLTKPVTLDGVLSPDEWPDDPASTAALDRADQVLAERRSRWRGPKDASAVVRVAVDAEALYLGVTVEDDVAYHPGEPWWYGDSLEVFLDTDLSTRPPGAPAAGAAARGSSYDEGDWQIFLMPANPTLHWGVAYHGQAVKFGDADLVGVRVASTPGKAGGYSLEARIPTANFPSLRSPAATTIGFALALNDVDRFLPSAAPGGAATPDPATYLSWNRGFVLYRKPSNFGRLELPERRAPAPPAVPAEGGGSGAIWFAAAAAALLVGYFVGPGSRRLARAGWRPKAAVLALDVLLAGGLAFAAARSESAAREAARARIVTAASEARRVVAEASDLGALDPLDPAARSRTMQRLLRGEQVPAAAPPAAQAYVPLSSTWNGADVRARIETDVALGGVEHDWPLAAPTPATALRVRIEAPPEDAEGRGTVGRARIGVLRATAENGSSEDLPLEAVLWAGAGERTVRLALERPASLVRLRWTPERDGPAATLLSLTAVREDGSERPVLLPTLTEDRVPVLTRPGATPGGAGFLGAVLAPGESRDFAVPPLEGADRLQLVVSAERAFPLTAHGLPVAKVEVRVEGGPPVVATIENGLDVDEERLVHAIKHSADMRSRIAFRWTDASGQPRHQDLVSIPLEPGRRPTSLRVENLGRPVAEQGTGAFVLSAATLTRRAAAPPQGALTTARSGITGRDVAMLRAPQAFADTVAGGARRGDAVEASIDLGPEGRPTPVAFAVALPESVGLRRSRTETALLTCFVLGAFLLVLLAVDAFGALRRMSPRLVAGVLTASLLPVAVVIVLADRRNAARLEEEREAVVRGWLAAAKNALSVGERREAQVGAQGLLQLVTSLGEGADPRRVRDAVSVFRRQAVRGGAAAAVVVKGRDWPMLVVEPETSGARVDGASFLADRTDAAGLYASPWDGLLLVASARGVGERETKKVVLGARVDDEFVASRVAAAIPDPAAEVVVLTRAGEPAGSAGPGGAALARGLSGLFATFRDAPGSREGAVIRKVPTEEGPRLAVVTPLESAESPVAPAAWLAVGVPRGLLDAQLVSMREELVGLGLAAAVLVACVAAMLARRIAGPVTALVKVTDAVRRGEFDVEVPAAGTDEVGDLAVAFDQMRRDLKQRLGDLAFLRSAQERVSESLDLTLTARAGLDCFVDRLSPPVALLLGALSPAGPVVPWAERGRASTTDRPVDGRPGGWLLEALGGAEPVVVRDAKADPRVAAEAVAGNRLLEECNAWLAVPLRAGHEVQGLAVLGWPGEADLPTRERAALLGPLGGVVAAALGNARLYRLAALDEATNLPGATAFEAALRRDVDAALAGGPAAVVLRVGLEGLDRAAVRRRGVEASRLVLRAAADALRSALEGRVQAGRLREDELAVRLPGATRDEAVALAQRVRERIAAAEVRAEDGESLKTTASVGVARCPEDATSVEFLLDAAGRALAAARRAGGDRVEDARRVDQGLVDVPPYEDGAVFRTEAMVRVLDVARRAARSDSTLLLTGETGVGKEVVADLVHRRSARAAKPFVKVNTAAFPETLLESELFGHEKGAFTGADRRREGRFELADGGTLFLDEVGEMSLSAQVRLLRVLAEGQLTRLGGTKPVAVDVRVIAATNQDLEKAVAGGRFREDLYYRLNVLRIEIPPLRERREEIPSLVEHFLADARRRIGRGPQRLSPQAMDVLYRHSWPGNARELRNVLERAAVMCEEEVAGPEHLRVDPARGGALPAAPPVAAPLDALNERQRKLLEHLARVGRCTNRTFIEMTAASPRTGLRDLKALIAKGLIVREGKRRGAVYRLP